MCKTNCGIPVLLQRLLLLLLFSISRRGFHGPPLMNAVLKLLRKRVIACDNMCKLLSWLAHNGQVNAPTVGATAAVGASRVIAFKRNACLLVARWSKNCDVDTWHGQNLKRFAHNGQVKQ